MVGATCTTGARHLGRCATSGRKVSESNCRRHGKIETWNETARLVDYTNLGLDTDPIEPYRFKKDYWISRPVWFWDKLRECEDIKEVTEPWLTATPDWVFCEDASRFYNYEDCREFLADTVSPFTQRFIKYFDEDEVDYQT